VRGGEDRGVRMSAVELARGGDAFYGAGEAVGRRGGGRWQWSFNPHWFSMSSGGSGDEATSP
jgi:hypothetical protein